LGSLKLQYRIFLSLPAVIAYDAVVPSKSMLYMLFRGTRIVRQAFGLK
jgi:hypothetical protein